MQTMAYAAYLKSIAATLGINMHEAQHVMVEREENGSIAALIINATLRVEGQLFVDATGEDAMLIGRSLGVPLEHWRKLQCRPCSVGARALRSLQLAPFAEIRTARAGWTALHPTRAATGVVHAYSSGISSDEAALESANAASQVKLATYLPFSESGVRARAWEAIVSPSAEQRASSIRFTMSIFMLCNWG